MLKSTPKKILIFGLLLSAMITGCASQDAVERENMKTTIQVNHGIVENVEEVDIKSKAAQGAVLGGVIGLASTHGSTGDHLAGAAAGAAIGGLMTRALEGSNSEGSIVSTTHRGDINV